MQLGDSSQADSAQAPPLISLALNRTSNRTSSDDIAERDEDMEGINSLLAELSEADLRATAPAAPAVAPTGVTFPAPPTCVECQQAEVPQGNRRFASTTAALVPLGCGCAPSSNEPPLQPQPPVAHPSCLYSIAEYSNSLCSSITVCTKCTQEYGAAMLLELARERWCHDTDAYGRMIDRRYINARPGAAVETGASKAVGHGVALCTTIAANKGGGDVADDDDADDDAGDGDGDGDDALLTLEQMMDEMENEILAISPCPGCDDPNCESNRPGDTSCPGCNDNPFCPGYLGPDGEDDDGGWDELREDEAIAATVASATHLANVLVSTASQRAYADVDAHADQRLHSDQRQQEEEAATLYRRVLTLQQRSPPRLFGPDHDQTSNTVERLAALYTKLGNPGAAKAVMSELPSSMAAATKLAEGFTASGNLAGAEQILRSSWATMKRVLGADNKTTMGTGTNLVSNQRVQ